MEAEIARLMASSSGGRSLAPSQNARLEKLRRAAEESLSRKVVEKHARSCPACGMSVEKVEGCNKMRYVCGCNRTSLPPSLPSSSLLPLSLCCFSC